MSDTRATHRVGLVGYGLAGAVFHAPLIATTPGLTLDAIVTRDPARRTQARTDHPGARIVDSADDLWALTPKLDLVVVATPNRMHVPIARAALDAGIGAVVDKPFAVTAAEGRSLIDDAQRRGLLLTVFQNRRWDGDFLTLRRLVATAALGSVYRFESRFERWRPTPKGSWRERSDPREAPGLLYDLGSHLIDQALLLFGPVAEVYAELDVRRPGVEAEDDAFVSLTHRSGVRSRLVMSAVAAQPAPRFRVLGAKAAYVKWGLDPQEDALRGGSRPGVGDWGVEPRERWGSLGVGDELHPVPTDAGAYPVFYAAVAAVLDNGAPPPVDPNDSVEGLEIIEAAHRSAAERTVISLA